jgi:hypothetical protein
LGGFRLGTGGATFEALRAGHATSDALISVTARFEGCWRITQDKQMRGLAERAGIRVCNMAELRRHLSDDELSAPHGQEATHPRGDLHALGRVAARRVRAGEHGRVRVGTDLCAGSDDLRGLDAGEVRTAGVQLDQITRAGERTQPSARSAATHMSGRVLPPSSTQVLRGSDRA